MSWTLSNFTYCCSKAHLEGHRTSLPKLKRNSSCALQSEESYSFCNCSYFWSRGVHKRQNSTVKSNKLQLSKSILPLYQNSPLWLSLTCSSQEQEDRQWTRGHRRLWRRFEQNIAMFGETGRMSLADESPWNTSLSDRNRRHIIKKQFMKIGKMTYYGILSTFLLSRLVQHYFPKVLL